MYLREFGIWASARMGIEESPLGVALDAIIATMDGICIHSLRSIKHKASQP